MATPLAMPGPGILPAVHASMGEAAGRSAVQLRDVRFHYRKRMPVLRGVSVDFAEQRITAILGASGSGKTTLLRLAKGLDNPQAGDVVVLGKRRAHGGWRLDRSVAYIPQQLGLVRSRSALENTLTGAIARVPTWRALLGAFPSAIVAEARGTLDSLGIGHKVDERVRNLSGGERQRVAIARALMQRPAVILADEFVSQLDPTTAGETLALFREIVTRGVSVIMTTHELDVVKEFADRVVVLRGGEKVFDAEVADVTVAELAAMIRA